MHPFPHHYKVGLSGGPSGYADLTSDGFPSLHAAAPPEFDGPGDAWSPEHLLLGSVVACFLLTFRSVARHARFEFVHLAADAEGIVNRTENVTRFTQIALRPTLTIADGANADRARELMAKAERHCLVSASLSTAVHLEPEIVVARAVA